MKLKEEEDSSKGGRVRAEREEKFFSYLLLPLTMQLSLNCQ